MPESYYYRAPGANVEFEVKPDGEGIGYIEQVFGTGSLALQVTELGFVLCSPHVLREVKLRSQVLEAFQAASDDTLLPGNVGVEQLTAGNFVTYMRQYCGSDRRPESVDRFRELVQKAVQLLPKDYTFESGYKSPIHPMAGYHLDRYQDLAIGHRRLWPKAET